MSLIIRSVNIRFLKTQETLINNLTFEVKKGETITLMGASGCGKSTFLSYICGSLSANFQATGEVFLDTHSLNELEPEKRKMGILYQDPLLFPHMNIFSDKGFYGLLILLGEGFKKITKKTNSQLAAGAGVSTTGLAQHQKVPEYLLRG